GLLRARLVQRRCVAAIGDYPSDDTHWDLPRQPYICRGERGEVQAASELDADSERVRAAREIDRDAVLGQPHRSLRVTRNSRTGAALGAVIRNPTGSPRSSVLVSSFIVMHPRRSWPRLRRGHAAGAKS